MQTTTNYALKKPDGTDLVKRSDFNTNFDIIDSQMAATNASLSDMDYQTAGGTATAITLTMQTLRNGYSKTFIASASNGGSATTINSKPVYKPGTTTAPNFVVGKAYTVWYNLVSGCFFIKASAEGSATASHVLAGDTFSNNNDTGLIGTLDLTNLISGNIRAGITINGVSGNSNVVDTSAGDATAVQILAGKKAYVDGALVTGTAVNKAIATITPSRVNQTIAANTLCTGIQTILGDADLAAPNIISGKNIFGVAGTATITALGGAQIASGSFYRQYSSVTVSLPFTPNFIVTMSTNESYVNIRQTAFSWYENDTFFNFSTDKYSRYTSSRQAGNTGAPCIDIGTNSFTWQATGGSGQTFDYIALKI